MSEALPQTYESILSVRVIDKDSEQKARSIFAGYKLEGILYDCEFDDEIWHATDDYSRKSLRFQPDEFLYKRFYEKYLGLSYSGFILALKTYVAFSFGDLVLNTIQTFINEVERIISIDPAELPESSVLLNLSMPQRVSEFFSMLPAVGAVEENIQSLMDIMDSATTILTSQGKARDLASFDSYFEFNDLLKEYWASDIDKDERLFYYPLYLWWQITAVLPLRPREFLVTPRNCLRKAEDGYYLSVRRDKLKGSDRKVTYRIETDYMINEYRIPDALAEEIQKYLDFTSEYDATEIDTLFVTDSHYHKWLQKKHSNSRYFTYINMGTVLRYFFGEIVSGRYGYKVIRDRGEQYSHMKDHEIQYIYLGDTRHLAMINILAEGGTPVLAMALAGHSNIDISMHYAGNLTSLIECRVYRQYKKMLTGGGTYELFPAARKKLANPEFVFMDDRSRCYSPAYNHGEFTDCEKALGPHGEIGDCNKCVYHRPPETVGFFTDIGRDRYRHAIEDDCKNLREVIGIVRRENGDPEDILQSMMKLQGSMVTYEAFCRERMLEEKEKEDGKTD